MMSPDGTWAVLLVDNEQQRRQRLRRRANQPIYTLDGGRRPSSSDAGGLSKPLLWDSPTSFITPYTDDADHDGYERCSVDGRCHDLGIPGTALIAGVYRG